ncbi:hypothetical protein, partial [Streptomyces sp. MBT53]|uniref:hypothetical protein n=1 Tax=Streptomyces sp. MBT53 TaxID=1488384 RepID=UPI001F39A412
PQHGHFVEQAAPGGYGPRVSGWRGGGVAAKRASGEGSASLSPVTSVAVLFLLPAGKSRSKTGQGRRGR